MRAQKGNGKLKVWQRAGLYLLTVFLPYFSRRINRLDHSLRGIFGVMRGDTAMPWLRKFAARWRQIESFAAVANLLHWGYFLTEGAYITIPERLLQVTSIPIDPSAMRLVQFELKKKLTKFIPKCKILFQNIFLFFSRFFSKISK